MYDLLLLNLVRRATAQRLRSGDFCGEVKVLLSKGIQGFQPVEEGQRRSVLTGLVDTYVHDSLVHMDVYVDGFLQGEALCSERNLQVDILHGVGGQSQGHQCLKEVPTMEAD